MALGRIFVTAGVLLAASISADHAAAQGGMSFARKTVTILSSFGPGGGYDIYCRLFAAHVGKHLPGNPTVVVRNMPGAGGMIGSNFLYNVAPKDGTVMGMVPQTVAVAHVLGMSGVKFDPAQFNWLGRINSNVEVEQTWHTSSVKKIADAKTYPAVLAGTGPDSSSVVFPRILNDMFGMKFKVVAGYEGVNLAGIAMERGEVEGMVRPWAVTKTMHPEWLREKKINLLLQYGLERHPELKEVPAVVDLAETDPQRQILTLYASGSDIGRSIVAPPGLLESTVSLLRQAFEATMHDPAFIEAIKSNGLDFDPMAGEKLQNVVRQIESAPANVIEKARTYSELK